ncbi:hypothetical protein HDK77DRAFT_160492 [Phyllosticta capitalensis]|uniref:ATP-grasp domain-containing protein n=1 Tax=Phyllosticta capitalensis TaxID=121624 RepID=A0ABR1YUC2_9PEZI
MGSLAPSTTTNKVLFITAGPRDESVATATPTIIENWNTKMEAYLQTPITHLREYKSSDGRTTTVTMTSLLSPTVTPAYLAAFTHIIFLGVDSYHAYLQPFMRLLKLLLPAAQRLNPSLHIHNPPAVVAWDANKTYLATLEAAGFAIPHTTYIDPGATALEDLAKHIAAEHPNAAKLVLKPSIAASGVGTHLIEAPRDLTEADGVALKAIGAAAATKVALLESEGEDVAPEGTRAMIMVQEFLPAIQPVAGQEAADERWGEWSFVVIAGKVVQVARKRPVGGEWRVNSQYGGRSEVMSIEDARVPSTGRVVAEKLWQWLVAHEKSLKKGSPVEDRTELLYARVDGVLGRDGNFTIMEAELIEPWLWLFEEGPGRAGLDAFVRAILEPEKGARIE